MSLRVLIVDDEPLARSRLRTLLGECRELPVLLVGEAGDAPQALALLQHEAVDMVLLDIHLPGADGMQLAAVLRELPEPPAVVFVTAHAEYAVDAFDLDAVDYLTKPVRLQRLQAALERVVRARTATAEAALEPADGDWLLISERGRTLRVPVAEVLYVKAEQKYLSVRTPAASHLMDGSLNQLEERFGPRFLRIHRNALVARTAIRALQRQQGPADGDGWVVRLAGIDDELDVSRRQLAAVRQALGE